MSQSNNLSDIDLESSENLQHIEDERTINNDDESFSSESSDDSSSENSEFSEDAEDGRTVIKVFNYEPVIGKRFDSDSRNFLGDSMEKCLNALDLKGTLRERLQNGDVNVGFDITYLPASSSSSDPSLDSIRFDCFFSCQQNEIGHYLSADRASLQNSYARFSEPIRGGYSFAANSFIILWQAEPSAFKHVHGYEMDVRLHLYTCVRKNILRNGRSELEVAGLPRIVAEPQQKLPILLCSNPGPNTSFLTFKKIANVRGRYPKYECVLADFAIEFLYVGSWVFCLDFVEDDEVVKRLRLDE